MLSRYPHFKGDPYKKSFDFIDIILLGAPVDGKFTLEEIIKSSNLEILEKDIALHIKHELQRVLIHDIGYIENIPNNIWHFRLTQLGKIVKDAGGHFVYLKQLKNKENADRERQRLNDEKLKYDVKNAKRIFKTYWWTFTFAVVGLIISLVLGILKLLEVFRILHS